MTFFKYFVCLKTPNEKSLLTLPKLAHNFFFFFLQHWIYMLRYFWLKAMHNNSFLLLFGFCDHLLKIERRAFSMTRIPQDVFSSLCGHLLAHRGKLKTVVSTTLVWGNSSASVLVLFGECWICLDCQSNEVSWTGRAQPREAMSLCSVCVPLVGLRRVVDLWRRGRRQVSRKLAYWWIEISSTELL